MRTYGVRIARSDTLELPRHRLAPVGESWRSLVAGLDGPVAVDLFCGAGGLSHGLEDAGCNVALAVDTDERALETHRANFPGRALAFDLGDPDRVDDLIELLSVVEVDVLSGGPPCQPFSRAGRSKIRSLVAEGLRPAHDQRRELWRAFARVAVEVRPRAVLMENVPDMALGDDGRVVRALTAMLETAGYEVDARLLDASRHGVPQHRQRLILVATRGCGHFTWPKGTQVVTVADAIGDLPELGEGSGGRSVAYDRPSTPFQRRARIGMVGNDRHVVFDHMTRAVRDDDREAFALMDATTSYADLPDRLRRYGVESFDDKYNRLGWGNLSRSITAHIAKDGYWYIHPGENRTLTVREAARLQTFPDRFRFSGSRSHAFTQIGNAVPPQLAASVARAVVAALANEPDDVGSDGPSTRRRRARKHLVDWFAEAGERGLWAQPGAPWPVLISTICGRRGAGDALAAQLLSHWPAPAAVAAKPESPGGGFPGASIEKRVAAVAAAGVAVAGDGWSADAWEKPSGLGPAGIRWVRAVGLAEGDVVASTGIVRVAARHELGRGHTVNGANARVLLAQFLGPDDDLAATVTGALALVAETRCRPQRPTCQDCPLAGDCRSAPS